MAALLWVRMHVIYRPKILALKPGVVGLLLVAASFGCGQRSTQTIRTVAIKSVDPQAPQPSRSARGDGFGLINADTFEIAVEGCRSKMQSLVTETNPQVRVYKGDYDCLAKLKTFSNDNGTYVPVDGMDFVTYQPGEVATFINGNLETIDVTVVSQLSNPTTADDEVDYRVNATVDSGNQVNLLDITEGPNGKFTQPKGKEPAFTIVSARLAGGDPATSAGMFEIILACQNAIKQQGNSFSCAREPINNLNYALVVDNYNDSPCDSVVGQTGCDEIMANNIVYPLDVSTEIIMPGEQGLNKGGLNLRVAYGGILGPPDMAHFPNMLLVLETANNYRWFNLDIKVSLHLLLHQMAAYGLETDNISAE